MSGLGLSGPPTIYSMPYLKAQHRGRREFQLVLQRRHQRRPRPRPERLGPHGLAAGRRPARAVAQPLLRRTSKFSPTSSSAGGGTTRTTRSMTTGSGLGSAGAADRMGARNSKSILLLEYGFPAVDKGTNQPNVFYDPKSVESFTPYWSIWDPGNERRLSAAARRHDRGARARGDLRILERRRQQRDVGGVAMIAVRVLLRLELGRAAVSRSSRSIAAHGATRATGSRANGSAGFAPSCRRRRRPRRRRRRRLSDLPDARHARLVDAHQAEVLDDHRSHVSGRETRGRAMPTPISTSN